MTDHPEHAPFNFLSPQMRIVHEAHTCSDAGEREIVLPPGVFVKNPEYENAADANLVFHPGVLAGPILDGSGLPVAPTGLEWPVNPMFQNADYEPGKPTNGNELDKAFHDYVTTGSMPTAGDTPLVTNSCKLVTNGQDEAVMAIVHTIIRDDVRRKLLAKWALRSVELVESQVSMMSENEAMKELIEMGDVQVEQEPE